MALETKIEVRSAKDVIMLIVVFCMFAGVGYVLYTNFFPSVDTPGEGTALHNFFSPTRQQIVNPNFSTEFLQTDQFTQLKIAPKARTDFDLGREQAFTPF